MVEAIMIDTAETRSRMAALIAAIDAKLPYAHPHDLLADVDVIRRMAYSHGMNPAVTVTHFLELALSRISESALVRGWLALLREAVDSERQDIETCHAFAAACSERLAA